MSTAPRVVTLGEVLLRLATPGRQRLVQAQAFDVHYGGAEANVAVSLAVFGIPSAVVTRLPDNPLGEAALAALRRWGVDVRHVLRGGRRLGVYFLEHGAVHRPAQVVYDRDDSAFAQIEPGSVAWDAVFEGAEWFHFTGITPALSASAAAVCAEAVEAAARRGLRISVDLNYRASLWRWGRRPDEVMPPLLERCHVVLADGDAARIMLGVEADTAGDGPERWRPLCEALAARLPAAEHIVVTARRARNASDNHYSAVLYRGGRLYASSEQHISHIVDRVGAGDAFMAGLIRSLLVAPDDPAGAVEFAVAAAALKHTVEGDANLVTVAEVERLAAGDRSGRIQR